MAILNMDFTSIPPQESIEPVPAGWYNVAVDQSEIKPTSKGDGMFLELRYYILDGQYKGRKIFDRFNLKNANPQAVEIGFRQLSSVAHALGMLQIGDTNMIHGRPLKVKVKVRPATEQYEASNDVTSRANINMQTDPAAASATPAAPAAWNAPPAAPAPAAAWGAPPAAAPTPAPTAAPPAPQAAAPAWSAPAGAQPWGQPAAPGAAAAPQAAPAPAAAPQAAPSAAQTAAPPWQQTPPGAA